MDEYLQKIPRYLARGTNSYQENYDVIIIGMGIAGLSCALECAAERRILLISKGREEDCNTYYSQGGIAAALSEPDSALEHCQDSLRVGGYFGNVENLNILTEEAPGAISFLVDNDVVFDRDEEGFLLAREGGHSRRRILRIDGDNTGKGILCKLLQKVKKKNNIEIWQESFVVDILSENNTATGVIVSRRGELLEVNASKVVVASGGMGGIFEPNTNAECIEGDGMALAFRAGAELTDLEFIQFHPTVFHHLLGKNFLISEALRGEGAILRNHVGERFMPKYAEEAELAGRDIVARAIYAEMKREESTHVFLDITHKDRTFLEKRFPQIFARCLECEIDISRDLIPVFPGVHYTIGGIKTDAWGRTNVQDLYAVGEVASTGVHGSNRLASNSLLEGVVFGRRVAQDINKTESKAKAVFPGVSKSVGCSESDFESVYADVLRRKAELKRIATEALGLIRNRTKLEKAIWYLESLEKEEGLYPTIPIAWEWQNMKLVTGLTLFAALMREESRGTHYREDFPQENEQRKHYIFSREGIREEIQ